jgi:hypothetical protein
MTRKATSDSKSCPYYKEHGRHDWYLMTWNVRKKIGGKPTGKIGCPYCRADLNVPEDEMKEYLQDLNKGQVSPGTPERV